MDATVKTAMERYNEAMGPRFTPAGYMCEFCKAIHATPQDALRCRDSDNEQIARAEESRTAAM